MAGALTQLVTADTQSYLIRTAWLKAQSSASPTTAKPRTELALQCGSDSVTASAATTSSGGTFSMGAARALPASFAPPTPIAAPAPEACDPADTAPGHPSACTPPTGPGESKRSR
jgi:hypothetical protein